MKQSFQWNMNVHIEYAEADIEVQSNCVTIDDGGPLCFT